MRKSKSTPAKSTPAPKLLGLRQLAAAISADVGQLSRESKQPGFPSHQVKGRTLFDPEEVIAWRAVNIRQRKPADPTAAAGEPGSKTPRAKIRAITSKDDPLYQALAGGNATAIAMSRAALQLAGKQVAESAFEGELSASQLDSLKKALGELRNAEGDYLELEKQKREVIPRKDVAALVAEMVGRLVRALAAVENTIATELAVWLADPSIAAMPADGRARKVREFVAKTSSDVRRLEADGVEPLINAMVHDD